MSPAESVVSSYSAWTEASKLVDAMGRNGLFSLLGLALTAEAWRGAHITDSMSWPEVSGRSVSILLALSAKGAFHPSFSPENAELIRAHDALIALAMLGLGGHKPVLPGRV